jgi:hypothetical protein
VRIRNTPQCSLLALALLFNCSNLFAQQYHALHGSDYAGAPAIFNNPASNVNSRHPWDITVFNLNTAFITNAIYLKNFKFPSVSNTEPILIPGTQNRTIHASFDIGLLNSMYKINSKTAIGAGIRLRTLNHFKTNSFAYNDTITSFHQFLKANRTTNFVDANNRHAGWLEFDLNYGRTLFETPLRKINIGATLQIMKGISGAYASINRLSYLESTTAFDTAYKITNGAGAYAYSSNYDNWSPYISTTGNINQFVRNTPTALGLSIGAEFLWFRDEYNGEENEPRQYNWKLGISILDIGFAKFKTSEYTGNFGNPKTSLEDWQISNKLQGIADARGLRDSLATLFDTTTALPATFKMRIPTRVIINSDHYLGNNFYVNAQASLNLYSSSYGKTMNLRELSLLTLTPRWETRNWGLYLPIQYNTQGQFWTGAAFKAGPLIMGIHDVKLFTKKDPMLNGGFYMLLQVHPFKERERKSRYDCL